MTDIEDKGININSSNSIKCKSYFCLRPKGNNNGVNFTDYGTIDILIPNQKFQYSYWSDNHGTEKTAENYLTITYTVHHSEQGTLVMVEHSNLQSEAMYDLMINVWDFLLNNLKNFVEKN